MSDDALAAHLLDHPDNLLNRLGGLASPREEVVVGDMANVLFKKLARKTVRHHAIAPTEKLVAAVSANLGGTAETADALGLDQSTVTAYKQGHLRHRHDNDLREGLDKALGRIKETAADRIIMALGAITEKRIEKGAERDVRVASGVAKDMAAIIEKTTPKVGDNHNVQVIVYTPEEKSEADYKKIQIPLVEEP